MASEIAFKAMESEEWETVKAILSGRELSNPDFEEQHGDWGHTLLTKAAERGQGGIVELLLLAGADIESKTKTALAWSARCGHLTVVQALCDRGAHLEAKDVYGDTALTLSAVEGHSAVVQALCNREALLEARDNGGETALTWSAMKGHLAVVQVLCSRGANIEAKSNYERTALTYSVMCGHLAVAQALRDRGAHLEVQANEDANMTPKAVEE